MKRSNALFSNRHLYLRMALVCLLVLGLLPASLASCPRHAYAATGTLSVGARINYAGFFTNFFTVDGYWAYCVNPSYVAPPNGTYSSENFWDHSATSAEWLAGSLYYSYGAPGFDPDMWPARYYDGSEWTHEKRLAVNHILWTNAYENTATPALFGTSKAFRDWYDTEMNDWYGNPNAANSYMRKARERFWNDFSPQYRAQFADSMKVLICPGNVQNIGYIGEFNPTGALELQKTSANATITNNNESYRLSGAKYGVYADAACKNLLCALTTDSNGHAQSAYDLPPGDVWVKELEAPAGYALDSTIYKATIPAGDITLLETRDVPQSNSLGLLLQKREAERGSNTPQGDGALAGAQFTVHYYDGFFDSAAKAEASGSPTCRWLFETDTHGKINLNNAAQKLAGDKLYQNSAGEAALPLGTYLLQETKAPEGYTLNSEVFVRRVTASGNEENVSTYAAPLVAENPIRGGVELRKLDAELQENTPLGAGSLGALFEIANASAEAVNVNGTFFAPGEVVYRGTAEKRGDGYVFSTDADGDGADYTLPFGTYTVRETSAGAGYKIVDPDKTVTFSIRKHGEVVRVSDNKTFTNQVMRGDLAFNKKSGVTGAKLAGIPFRITSKTTGESHIIVTDYNGNASTATSWNKHSANTNANDAAVDAQNNANEALLNPSAGIWFGAGAPVNDALGALPYDTYLLEELRVEANAGLALVKDELIIGAHEDGQTVNYGTIDDNGDAAPYLSTNAFDGASGDYHDSVIAADERAVIVDQLNYGQFMVGETYTAHAELAYAENGEPVLIDGAPVTGSSTFTTTSPFGTAQVELRFDASDLPDNCALVVLETVTRGGSPYVEHKDLADAAQTVRIKRAHLKTAATVADEGGNTATIGDNITVIDHVEYSDVIADGREYVMTGQLMRKATETADDGSETAYAEEYLDAAGNPVTAEARFTPINTHGFIDLTYSFDGSNLSEGDVLVVFERLLNNEAEVAAHADINYAPQSVTFITPPPPVEPPAPLIRTAVTDALDDDGIVIADKNAHIIDTVYYENLIPENTYTLTGTLMNKTTLLPLMTGDPEQPESSLPITTQMEFTPHHSSGKVALEYRFDASYFAESGEPIEAVAYAVLLEGDETIASHCDPQSPEQSFSIVPPQIGTRATAKDGSQVIEPTANVTITDEVSYTNILPQYSYTLQATVMDKATGKPLEIDSEPVTASRTFVANESRGSMPVEFNFDASELGDRELVVFEQLYKDGNPTPIASHEDLDDKGQTIWVGTPPEPPREEITEQTGDTLVTPVRAFILAAVMAAGALSLLALKGHRSTAAAQGCARRNGQP